MYHDDTMRDETCEIVCRLIDSILCIDLKKVTEGNSRLVKRVSLPSRDCNVAICLYRNNVRIEIIKRPKNKTEGSYLEMKIDLDKSGTEWGPAKGVWNVLTYYLKRAATEEILFTNMPRNHVLPSAQLQETLDTAEAGEKGAPTVNTSEEEAEQIRQGTEA